MRVMTVSESNWWRRALAGEAVPVVIGCPEAGYYARKQHRGGPWQPARIWLERQFGEDGEQLYDDKALCLVGGREADAHEQWPWLAGHPISADEYKRLSRGETALLVSARERQAVLVNSRPVF